MKEIWKKIPSFENKYKISNMGNVQSIIYKPKVLKAFTGNLGYRCFNLRKSGKTYHVRASRLVLNTFVGICPEGKECSHLNGKCKDDRLSNLIWERHQKNMRRKIEHGTETRGERHGMSKLKTSDVFEIRKLLLETMDSQATIGKLFHVKRGTISAIKCNRCWGWLTR